MYCPNCGQELPQSARYCGACGAPIPLSDFEAPNETAHGKASRFEDAASVSAAQAMRQSAPMPQFDSSAQQPTQKTSFVADALANAPYAFGATAMAITGFCWIAAIGSFCAGGIDLVASTLDAASTALAFTLFMVACIVPVMLAFLSSAQVIRGFLEKDFAKTAKRALRWAWPCLLVCIALMGLCIAFSGMGGSAWLHALGSFCDYGLGASIAGTIISSLGILIFDTAATSPKQSELSHEFGGFEGAAP